MKQQQPSTKYIVVVVLALVNFGISYYSFRGSADTTATITTTSTDKLSGEQYVPTANEENPFGPYFVGFDTLTNRGVSTDHLHYIYDVLTNFTMYNVRQYGAKVSYVDKSFKRISVSGIEPKYSFKFGVNGANIHTLVVSGDIVSNSILVRIQDNKGAEKFNRTFTIYNGYESDNQTTETFPE
ncbi:hypothetical protein BH09PAT4_BH09PAT4_03240 [soil metagenome]